jgi:N-terminal acetyltransferase B complex non-catalytic subunit
LIYLLRVSVTLSILEICSHPSEQPTQAALQRTINVHKLLRYNFSEQDLTAELETSRASLYIQQYLEALKFGNDLPVTELQPADDLAVLAAHAFINLWKQTEDETQLFNGAAILEFASTKSTHSFQMRVMLIRIYRLLGTNPLSRGDTILSLLPRRILNGYGSLSLH